ncbi:hypothetical protein Hanom_Chr05g00447811 [Helianthus anomalus]
MRVHWSFYLNAKINKKTINKRIIFKIICIYLQTSYTQPPLFSSSLTILTPPHSTYRCRRHHHRHPPATTTTSLQHSSVVSRTHADGWRLWYFQICTKMKCYFTHTVTLRETVLVGSRFILQILHNQ